MSDSSTDLSACYGPLAGLIGTWSGAKGSDLAPEPDGSDTTPYYETLSFEAAGDVENAEEQVLGMLFYRQIVRKKINDEVFHDQTGYWMWDAEARVVMQSLTIPRGLCLLAGGAYEEQAGDELRIGVSAKLGDADWGIVQSPFLRDKARTVGFCHELRLEGDRLSYSETTSLEIYGRSFEHTDSNELTRQAGA